MTALHFLPIEDIRCRPDARPLDDVALAGLAESIGSIGLINPIRVRRLNGGYEVVAGTHRFAACDSLGHGKIACFVVDDDDLHAELAMIDENLCRAELSAVDKTKQTTRREAIYLELHPETADGKAQALGMNRAIGNNVSENFSATPSFAADTASKTGQTDRTVRLYAERGKKIVPQALDEIQGTPLDRGVYLDRLKRVEPAQQLATVRLDLEQPRQGGVAGRYVQTTSAAPPDNSKLYARFIEIADEFEAMSVAALIDGAGRKRAVLGQRASGLADRMCAIMEGLDQ